MAEPTAVLPCRMLKHESGRSVVMLVSYLWSVRNTIPFLFQGEPQVTPLPTAEPGGGSGIADPSLVSEGSATPDEGTSLASQPYFSLFPVGGARGRGKIRLDTLASFPCHEGM